MRPKLLAETFMKAKLQHEQQQAMGGQPAAAISSNAATSKLTQGVRDPANPALTAREE